MAKNSEYQRHGDQIFGRFYHHLANSGCPLPDYDSSRMSRKKFGQSVLELLIQDFCESKTTQPSDCQDFKRAARKSLASFHILLGYPDPTVRDAAQTKYDELLQERERISHPAVRSGNVYLGVITDQGWREFTQDALVAATHAAIQQSRNQVSSEHYGV
jgi:hypothetical protein